MKQQRKLSVLAAGAAVMALLLGASPARAADVIFGDPARPTKATSIQDLVVDGTTYDVTFVFAFAFEVYGPFPGSFPIFDTLAEAENAVVATSAALTAESALQVGEANGVDGFPNFNIGFASFLGPFNTESVSVARAVEETGEWIKINSNPWLYNLDERSYAVFTVAGGGPPPSDPVAIAASSLPASRSVQVGNLASVFATIINGGSVTATGCGIAPDTSVAATFSYQTTDASNVPVGSPNTPADIAAGGSQNYIFAFTPTASISPTQVFMNYDCTNSAPAPVTVGLNTLLLSAEAAPVPDIVALAATATGDGIVNLPGTNGSNAFSVATVNVGSTATITATAAPSTSLPLVLSICETNPATGACLSGPGSSATSSVAGGATPTYSVFVTGTGTVPFDPANNRIIVLFRDAGAVIRGATSVAVRTQ